MRCCGLARQSRGCQAHTLPHAPSPSSCGEPCLSMAITTSPACSSACGGAGSCEHAAACVDGVSLLETLEVGASALLCLRLLHRHNITNNVSTSAAAAAPETAPARSRSLDAPWLADKSARQRRSHNHFSRLHNGMRDNRPYPFYRYMDTHSSSTHTDLDQGLDAHSTQLLAGAEVNAYIISFHVLFILWHTMRS